MSCAGLFLSIIAFWLIWLAVHISLHDLYGRLKAHHINLFSPEIQMTRPLSGVWRWDKRRNTEVWLTALSPTPECGQNKAVGGGFWQEEIPTLPCLHWWDQCGNSHILQVGVQLADKLEWSANTDTLPAKSVLQLSQHAIASVLSVLQALFFLLWCAGVQASRQRMQTDWIKSSGRPSLFSAWSSPPSVTDFWQDC